MAIALGQPVEEITLGMEAIKVDAIRVPEKTGNPEVQAGSRFALTDVPSVQAHRVGQKHPSGEMVAQMRPSDATGIELKYSGPPSVLAPPFVDGQVVEQEHPGVEQTSYVMEQIPQHLYAVLPQVPFQGPLYTGYPPQFMDMSGYYTYPLDGVAYPSPIVDYSHVYNRNCYYSAPATAPYSVGYSLPYSYPQYEVSPLEHYNVPATSSPLTQEGMMIPEVQIQDPSAFMQYGYQPMNPNVVHGQWVPVAMGGPPADEGMPTYAMSPYSDSYVPVPLHVQPPAWVPQPEGPEGPNEGDVSKLGLQQLSILSDSGHDAIQNDGRPDLQKVDSSASVVDNKKNVKKQLGFVYGPTTTMPVKASWVRAGHLNCISTAYPVKPLSAKAAKSSGTHFSSVEPIAKVEVNSADFPTDYEDAKHFIIKSFSEENVHRSIQYGVWASTANGNKKLDEAFKDAQHRAIGKARGCPVFLYFSVNGSGRFCGVAEMVGPVDFNNTMDFWERNRWCGSFPVKWHFIKDVPHCQLRRIILQNNENKPVTSSRDTQEVNFEQGLQMLSIIKGYSTKASILDNFPSPLKALSSAMVEPPAENRAEPNSLSSMADNGEPHEEPATGTPENSNALRASNGEAKPREAPPQGKLRSDMLCQGPAAEVGARKPDKENVIVLNPNAKVAT